MRNVNQLAEIKSLDLFLNYSQLKKRNALLMFFIAPGTSQ